MPRRLQYVQEFIEGIHDTLSVNSPNDKTAFWIDGGEEGSLLFNPSEVQAYSDVIACLSREFAKQEDLSRRSIEQFLQRAIFHALDLRSKRGGDFGSRLGSALQHLHEKLKEKPSDYTCFVPVEGLDCDGLPARFGDARFVVFRRPQLRLLRKAVTVGQRSASRRAGWEVVANGLKSSEIWEKPCVVVKVRAKDFDAASVLARRKARNILDTLNFFADLVPYNHGWLHFPGEAVRAIWVGPILKAGGGVSVPQRIVGPLIPFSFRKLRETRRLQSALNALQKLYRTRTKETNVLLAAVQWAGRATVESRRERRFLLYAIALESIMLPEKGQELRYRLALRTAHLLGRNRSERRKVFDRIRKLYDLRSQIVHSGSCDVTDEDLADLRSMVKKALLHLLRARAIREMSQEELEKWFEHKVLRL